MNWQLDLFETSVQEEPGKITEEDMQKAHDKAYTQRLLTPEEWKLYRIIKANSLMGKKTTQKEICNLMGYKYNDDPKAHDPCPKVWTLIKNLNESNEIEKIIISFNFEYWLGNEQETKVYMDKLWNDLEPRLVRYWKYLKKIKKNGQGKLLSTQLEPIDEESHARKFVESYEVDQIYTSASECDF